MTTCADLVGATRRHLQGGGRPQLNLLDATVSDTTTTIGVTYDLNGIQPGAYLAVGLEVMYVWEVNSADKTAVVQRAQQGSAAASHPSGSVVYVNAPFTDWDIFNALNAELTALSSPINGLYQIRSADLLAVSGQEGYDFPTVGFLSVADIRWQETGTVSHEWPELTDYTVSQNLPMSAFPSGTALFFNTALPSAQQTVRVRYRAQLDTFTDLTDDVAGTGLPGTAWDIPPLGAAITVMSGRPVVRADTSSQGDTRRADEVRVGDVISSTAALRAQRSRRVGEEAARLAQVWPQHGRPRVTL